MITQQLQAKSINLQESRAQDKAANDTFADRLQRIENIEIINYIQSYQKIEYLNLYHQILNLAYPFHLIHQIVANQTITKTAQILQTDNRFHCQKWKIVFILNKELKKDKKQLIKLKQRDKTTRRYNSQAISNNLNQQKCIEYLYDGFLSPSGCMIMTKKQIFIGIHNQFGSTLLIQCMQDQSKCWIRGVLWREELAVSRIWDVSEEYIYSYIQADNKDDAKYIYLFCYIKSSNNKKDMSEMGDSSNRSDFSENLEGEIIDEEYNKVFSDCHSFLESFKQMAQNQQGLTEIDIDGIYQNPHHKLSWEQSKIEIPCQKHIKFFPNNLGLLQSDYDQMSPPELKKMLEVLIKQNEEFRYNFHVVKQKLQYIIINIHKKLSSLKNFDYFTNYSPQSQIVQCVDMTKFIERTINKITENSFQFSTLEQNVLYLKVQNQVIFKDIQKLMAFIQERKIYSQNLKSKIVDLKSQLKKQKEKNQGIEKYIESLKAELIQTREKQTASNLILEQLNKIEENVDLKFRNRSDLIRMVKSLSVKILKHQKECPGMGKQMPEGQVLHQYLNSISTKKKPVNPENK